MRNRFLLFTLFCMLVTLAFAQKKTINGIVLDAKGETVIGASVVIKGSTIGTITDLDGRFSLSNVPSNGVIQVTYIGYKMSELSVTNQNSFKITLVEDAKALDEVVVVGYGSMKKSDLTGAMSRVTSKQIEERPVQNALQAMQGKTTGVDVTSNNRPGELGDIRIRGNRSINATNDPLYVIDGIPMAAGSMADVNPNDIESMEILKDASATAIYGSRGANGVILITTKKGKVGKVSINYDGSFTFSDLCSTTDYMNAGQLLDYKRQAAITGGTYNGAYGNAPDPDRDAALWLGTQSYMTRILGSAYELDSDGAVTLRNATTEEIAAGYSSQVPVYDSSKMLSTDWGKLVTRTAFSQNHQISLSAGTETSKLYMSLAYLNQESTMKDQDYQRYTVNLNGEIAPTKWLRVGMGMNASHSIKNYGIVSNFSNTVAKDSYGLAMTLMPYAPAYDGDGSILIADDGLSEHNILRNINEATNEYRYYGAMLSSFAEATILPWLKWRTNFGVQFRNSRYGSYYGENFTNPFGYDFTEPNTAYDSHSQSLSWTLENLVYINKTFNKIHTLGITLMQSAEKYRTESLSTRAFEVVYPTSLWYNVGASTTSDASIASGYSTWQRASYMARLNYSLLDRYLLTATGRYDGASMLAEGHKWDFFPSVALAWKMQEENFMKDIRWIDQLKLRVGYGVTGNSSVSPYSTAGSCTSTYANYPFGAGNITENTTGTKTDVMPNENLCWEKTASTNFGIDYSILKNRISGSIEYYIANTSDLLMSRSIPVITGYASLQDNVGKTQNKGLEISLSTVNVKTKDFTWQTDFTFSTNKEKIVELANGKVDDTSNEWFIGKPITAMWDYKYDRLWQNTTEDKKMMAIYALNGLTFLPGQVKIVDQQFLEVDEGTDGSVTKTVTIDGTTQNVTYMSNGFGTFSNDDKYILGSKNPKWVGGINNTFTYKNWQLNFFTYFRMGNMYYGLAQTIGRRVEKDTWSETNTDAKFAQPTTATRTSTYDYVRNYSKGNMILIRNIALSYTVPNSQLNRIGLGSAQVYAQVLNPFMFGGELVKAGINPDDTTGWDSKTSGSYIGGQTNNTAITRSFVLGVRIGF
jgi:TonB-dependent starch-binding outer membrane protein SusC